MYASVRMCAESGGVLGSHKLALSELVHWLRPMLCCEEAPQDWEHCPGTAMPSAGLGSTGTGSTLLLLAMCHSLETSHWMGQRGLGGISGGDPHEGSISKHIESLPWDTRERLICMWARHSKRALCIPH